MPHNVYFKKGELKNLPSTKSAGTIYVTTDERAMYVDVNDSTRIRLGDFREYPTWEAIQALDRTNLSTTALYYATQENILCKYTGTAWTQINPDTICQLTENKLTGADVAGGVQITSKVTDQKGSKEDSIAIKGGTNVTVAMDGNDVKISAADKETTLTGHYTPIENEGSKLQAASGFITAIKRDAKGHVVGIDTSEQATNAVKTVTTTAEAASGEGKTGIDITTTVDQATGGAKSGILNVVGGGATSVSVDNGSLKISSTDKSVTAVGNHYVPTGYDASKLSASKGKVISAVNTDAAGHVTTVTTREENEVTDSSFEVTAATGGGASISQTINQKNGTARTSSNAATIVGDGATTVSVVDGKVQVSTPVSSESNHYQASGASAGTKSASGATGTAKQTVQVVTGVTTDKNGHVTGIVSGAATDTHANISEVTAAANTGNGFDITVKDTDNTSKSATLDPVIKVGSTESSVHFVNGVADLDVYTITETDNKIADALKAANAMVIRGEVNTTKALPTTNVQAGDTYIVTEDGVAFGEGQKLEVGDLLVAKADKATGVGTSDWYYVPAGNDIAYLSPSANAIELKTKSDDVTSGKISFAAPAANQSGIKVGMNNIYANNYYTSELTFDMVWGEF